jgi:hypothetical protein
LKRSAVEPNNSLDKILISLFLVISSAVIISSLFGYFLVIKGGFGETLSSIALHSRYIDNLLPAFLTLGVAQYWRAYSSFGLIQRVFPIIISSGLIYFGMFVLNSGITIGDPIRSPYGYQISIGRPLEVVYLQSVAISLIIIHFLWMLNHRIIIFLPIVSILLIAKPLGWDKSIAEYGWQQNHLTATFINNLARAKQSTKFQCVNLDLRSSDNWWTRESLRYWLEIPVFPITDKTCQYLVTDYTITEKRQLFIERQATDIYIYSGERYAGN